MYVLIFQIHEIQNERQKRREKKRKIKWKVKFLWIYLVLKHLKCNWNVYPLVIDRDRERESERDADIFVEQTKNNHRMQLQCHSLASCSGGEKEMKKKVINNNNWNWIEADCCDMSSIVCPFGATTSNLFTQNVVFLMLLPPIKFDFVSSPRQPYKSQKYSQSLPSPPSSEYVF